MARTASSRQSDAVAANDRRIDFRAYVDDSGGSQVDWAGWVKGFEITESIDRTAMTCEITFHREQGSTSLSPFVGSPPQIAENRNIEIEVAVNEAGNSPQASDWEPIFRGAFDRWGTSTEGPDVTFSARDSISRQLIDTLIDAEKEYGNDAGTDPVEDVIQDILDDQSLSITLTTSGNPDLGILTYTQQRESVHAAHGALTDLIGWVARPVWSETVSPPDWVYTLYEPDRTKTTPDHTFGPGDYTAITDFEVDKTTVRNYVIVKWSEDAAAEVAEDSTSQAEHGVLKMYVDVSSDPQIDSSTKASNLATAIVGDLAQPRATQAVRIAFNPFVELGDLCRFSANDTLYDSAQDMAITSYTHRLTESNGFETILYTRGQPSGGADRWHRLKRRTEQRRDIEKNVVTKNPEIEGAPQIGYDKEDGTVIVSVAANKDTIGIWGSVGVDGATPADPELEGTILTTDAAYTAGDTQISTPDDTGVSPADEAWYIIVSANGTPAELFFAEGAGTGALTIRVPDAAKLSNDYPSGSKIYQLSPDASQASDTAWGIHGRSGTYTLDGHISGVSDPEVRQDVGGLTTVKARAVNNRGELGEIVVSSRRRGDTKTIPPRVSADAVRVGDDVSVEFAIEDPTLALTGNPTFALRDGDDQSFGSELTSWDTSTGTAGSDTTLTRKETTTDPTVALRMTYSYTDENGATVTEEALVAVVDVVENLKTVKLHASAFHPDDGASTDWAYQGSGARLKLDVGASATNFVAPFPGGVGAVITEARMRSNCVSAGDEITAQIRTADNVGTSVSIATMTRNTGTGWTTTTATFSSTIPDDESVYVNLYMETANLEFVWVEYDLALPSFKQTFA